MPLLRVLAVLASFLTAPVVHADWSRFRGPNGSGVSDETTPTPVDWGEDKNLQWKLPLPGPGVSCPIVVGDKVFVTCYSGYGESRDNIGNMEALTRHLLCIDKASGKVLWEKSVPSSHPEDPYAGAGVPQHGYASHTPTSDGEHIYVFFGKSGVFAFDLDGRQLWHTSVGIDSDPNRWGSSSSPILHQDVLVVTAGPESRAVVGLDKQTGKELWRADAEGLGMVWGTPAVAEASGVAEIVLGAPYEIWALNPQSGKLRWYCAANNDDQFSSSVIANHGIVYAFGGRGGGSVAVKAGGKDDVSETNLVWKGNDSTRFSTPILYEERLYNVSGGIVTCLSAQTGEEIFKGRLQSATRPSQTDNGQDNQARRGGGNRSGRGGFGGGMGSSDYASPIIADGKLYYIGRGGDMYVLEAGNEFKLLAVNRVTNDNEDFSATPAVSDGRIYIRSNKHLYCIGKE